LLWSRWPTNGPLGTFANAREYDAMLDELVRCGAISDPGMIYHDVRPSPHLPTLELRIADACPRIEDVLLIAGLFRAIVSEEIDGAATGRPVPRIRTEVVRAATWRAARSGLEGELVDPIDGSLSPAPQLLGLGEHRYSGWR
jgi:carboxylate-amine ligase